MNLAILIVDDEPLITAAIQRLLRPDGYQIHVAHDGPTGLRLLEDTDVAVLICDQRMPGMTGTQVLAESARKHPDTYRITVSGYADLQTVQESINEGHVQRLLLKPWNDAQLRSAVQEGVQHFQLVRENRRLLELTQQQKAELEAWNRKLTGEVQQRTAELDIQNRDLLRLQQRMTESLYDVVNVLSAMIEASEPNVALHCKRVAQLARLLGERLTLEPQALRDVEFAARLHEIGRAGRRSLAEVPSKSRCRPRQGDLNRHHAAVGCAILSHVRGFEDVARALQCQHERYDGSGFPEGLRSDDIPLAARIVTVADAYDNAVYSSRHATRVSEESGRRELLGGQGKAFDPLLVRHLLEGLDALGCTDAHEREIELPPEQVAADMVLSRDLRNVHGVLVLRTGTRLTAEHVGRIRDMSAADPLLCGVFVRCQPGEAAEPALTGVPLAASVGPNSNRREQAARVLVVDDDDLVRRALVREFRGVGWEVVCAQDGREAQNILEDGTFDMLVVDVAMPVMSGASLVAHVQQCWPDQSCLVLTGHATREQLERLVRAPNVVGILAKPWDHERLIALIRAGIDKKRHTREEGPV